MAQQYTDLANSSAGDRQGNAVMAMVQTPNGTDVWLEFDPSGGGWFLTYSSDHLTSNQVTSLSSFASSGSQQLMALAVDSSSNIYVVGTDSTTSTTLRLQAFTPSGSTWSAQTSVTSATFGSSVLGNLAVKWCNTGGGTGNHGHILVIGNQNSVTRRNNYGIFDAGALLTGTATLTASGNNPTFMGTPTTQTPTLDMENDGFGATSGLSAVGNTASSVTVGNWGVSNTGTLTTNTAVGTLTSLVLTSSKIRCIRYSSGHWAVVAPGATTSSHYETWLCTTASVGTGVDSGTPTNMPLNGAGVEWDAFLDPNTANQIWVIAMGTVSGANLPISRVSCALGSGTPVWAGAATADDTLTGIDTTLYSITAVKQPTAVTWHVTLRLGTPFNDYCLLGDYSAGFNVAPSSSLQTPSSGSSADTTFTTTFTATGTSTDGFNINAYAFRLKYGSGSYQYWNATSRAFQASIVWNNSLSLPTGSTISVAIPSGTLTTNNSTISWSIAAQEAGSSLQGSFPSDFTLNAIFLRREIPGWATASTTNFSKGIDQMLGLHNVNYCYQGTSILAETGYYATFGQWLSLNGLWVDQPFNSGSASSLSRVELPLSLIGSGADVTVSLYADSGGQPTGNPIASTTFPLDFLSLGLTSGTLASTTLPVTASMIQPITTPWVFDANLIMPWFNTTYSQTAFFNVATAGDTVNNQTIAIGGNYSGATHVSNVVGLQVFDGVDMGAWTTSTFPIAISGTSAVVMGGSVYTIGGENSSLTLIASVYNATLSAGSVGHWGNSYTVLPTAQASNQAGATDGTYLYYWVTTFSAPSPAYQGVFTTANNTTTLNWNTLPPIGFGSSSPISSTFTNGVATIGDDDTQGVGFYIVSIASGGNTPAQFQPVSGSGSNPNYALGTSDFFLFQLYNGTKEEVWALPIATTTDLGQQRRLAPLPYTDTQTNSGFPSPGMVAYTPTLDAYAYEVMADLPVGWWKLNEPVGTTTAYDASGNADNGTFAGGVTLAQTGPTWTKSDLGCAFDGSTGNVTAGSGIAMNLTSIGMTLECWFQSSMGGQLNSTAVLFGGSTGMGLAIISGKLGAYLNGSVSATYNVPGDTKWHHLAAVYTGVGSSTRTIYLDGVQVATDTSGTAASLTFTPEIGTNANSTGQRFTGNLAQCAVYPTALTASRVLTHYQQGVAQTGLTIPYTPTRVFSYLQNAAPQQGGASTSLYHIPSLSVPLPATLTPSTVYHVVISSSGSGAINAGQVHVGGVSSLTTANYSTNSGSTWHAYPQARAVPIHLFTGSGGPLYHTYEDNGTRWTYLMWQNLCDTGLRLKGFGEYVSSGARQLRTITYADTSTQLSPKVVAVS